MIGRTIVAVDDLDYSGKLIRLDDGTAIELHGEGYDVEGVSVEHLDVAAAAARLDEEARRRELRWLDDLQFEHRLKVKAARIAEAKASMSAADFAAWYEDNYPTASGVAKMLKDSWVEPIKAALHDSAVMFNRQAYGS